MGKSGGGGHVSRAGEQRKQEDGELREMPHNETSEIARLAKIYCNPSQTIVTAKPEVSKRY
jgi:hypothetical protein